MKSSKYKLLQPLQNSGVFCVKGHQLNFHLRSETGWPISLQCLNWRQGIREVLWCIEFCLLANDWTGAWHPGFFLNWPRVTWFSWHKVAVLQFSLWVWAQGLTPVYLQHPGEGKVTRSSDGVVWWCSPPDPTRPPGDLRTSRHCVLAFTARAVSWDVLALLSSSYKSSEFGWSGTPWLHLELLLLRSYLPGKISELYILGSTGIVWLLLRYQNYLIPVVARMEIYWCLKSIISRPCKQPY